MKFRLKITLCMLGILSVLFGVGGSLLITLSFQSTLEREKDAAFDSYQMALGTLQIVNSVQGRSDYQQISKTLDQLSEQNAAWSSLRLSAGDETIFERGAVELAPGDFPGPAGDECRLRCRTGTDGRRYLELSGSLSMGEQPLSLTATRDITSLYETRRSQQGIYLRIFGIMIVLCMALAYSISYVLTSPLESLSKVSRSIATGQLNRRARVRSEDEIGVLTADFNTMAERLEGTIHDLQDAVERQERFMGGFAHELKTPMTSIIGYADLLRGQSLSPEEQAEAAHYIFSEGKRLESLSLKLLDILVLKKRQIGLAPVKPSLLIRNLVDHLAPIYAARGIELSCRCEKGACLLDADLVQSMLLNLVDNAGKALSKGGHIEIRAAMEADGCRLCVLDNGPGFPAHALEHLTEAFYRADKSRSRQQGGVGLGLTLCQEIASLHNGSIRFANRAGGGALVAVELRGGRV